MRLQKHATLPAPRLQGNMRYMHCAWST